MKIFSNYPGIWWVPCLFISCLATAQTVEQTGIQPNAKDTLLRTGKLSNGLSYFIRRDLAPAGLTDFSLVVNVGSIVEEPEERGLAHFLEHMNFNGTTHYPGNGIVDYLQKKGASFGSTLQGSTGFEQTDYGFRIPLEDSSILRNALQILRDWAQGALLEDSEIEKERGVVLEEKRGHTGALSRMKHQYNPLLVNHSKYAEETIGTDEVLKYFKPEVLRRFYEKWYRPDLEAVIIVGDIDVEDVEQKIKALFGDMKIPANPLERKIYTIPLSGKNQFAVFTDKEQPGVQVEVQIKREKQAISASSLRQFMANRLLNSMLGARGQQFFQMADKPFTQFSNGLGDIEGKLATYRLFLKPLPGELEKSFKAAWRETERLRQHGFSAIELDKAKKAYLQTSGGNNELQRTINSAQSKSNFKQRFLQEVNPELFIVDELLGKDLLPSISLSEINKLIRSYLKDTDRDIFILAPEKEKAQLPDSATVSRWINMVRKEKLSPFKEDTLFIPPGPLIEKLAAPGRIVGERKLTGTNYTELVLSNGMKVVLMPTTLKKDEVIFELFSPGGSSLYQEVDLLPARYAAQVISASGIGRFNAKQLNRKMQGQRVSVYPTIRTYSEGLNGSASPASLETALQLLYLNFTAPRKDSTAIRDFAAKELSMLTGYTNTSEYVLQDTIDKLVNEPESQFAIPTQASLKKLDLDRIIAIYKERFSDASDFTAVFTGNFDSQAIRPLIEKYLGALPATHRPEKPVLPNLSPATPRKNIVIRKGLNSTASVRLEYRDEFSYSDTNLVALNALSTVLKLQMIKKLREEDGGIYIPFVHFEIQYLPSMHYRVQINFDCDPINAERMLSATEKIIDDLQKTGGKEDDLVKFRQEAIQQRTLLENSNRFWMENLIDRYKYRLEQAPAVSYAALLSAVNTETVKQAAQQYLPENRKLTVTLLPEGAK